MSNFWVRAITGTIFVALLVTAIVFGGAFLYGVFGLFAILGLAEFYSLFKNSNYAPNKFGIVLGGLIYASALIPGSRTYIAILGIGLFGFAIIAIWELFRKKETPFQNISLTILGLVYVILPFFLLFELRTTDKFCGLGEPPLHTYIILLSLFIMVWCNDTFAYLVGRAIGKNKLFERISPKKTWEGFIGGILFAIGAAVLLSYLFELEYTKMITYGAVIGIFGTAGDLVQSMLKRSLGVKDSGKILPGHGGILDRFDGVIFVAPIIFYLDRMVF